MKKYIVRFENGERISTILLDNAKDRDNKAAQAEKWRVGNPSRVYIESDDNRSNVKYENDKIRAMTTPEIEAKEKASKPKTSKDLLLEMLDDDAVKAKIQDIVA